ncbi:MAG: DinB family protein, partial [Candidatus Acidiferrum sp.]
AFCSPMICGAEWQLWMEADMTIGQSMLPEFDEEMKNTRKVLDRVPDDKWGWKPHEKSGTMGWLAGHVGTVPEWITMTINTKELDYAPVNGPSYEPPKITNRKELLAAFDKGSAEARAALAGVSDEEIVKGWKLLAGGQEIFTLPRVACIRGMCMNHMIHHRAQLTVYFRLVGVPVPGLYGPSADESQQDSSAASAN